MILSDGIVFDEILAPNGRRMDIRIEHDLIVEVGFNLAKKYKKEKVSLRGYHVYPGFIDMHVHLREPGQTHKETIASATLAAAAGGVTTVVAMPNTTPPIDTAERYQEVMKLISEKARVEVLHSASLTIGREGKEITNFEALQKTGCRYLTDDGTSVQDIALIQHILEKIKDTSLLWIEHPEIRVLAEGKPLHDGVAAKKIGIAGQPREAESLAIWQLGLLAGRMNVRVHFTHISTWQSVEAVRTLKTYYPNLFSADTCPHYLFFTEEDVMKSNYDTNKKMNPPLREAKDRLALLDAILDGTIDCVASDHAPHTAEEKSQNITHAPFGVIGLETLFPALYTLCHQRKRLEPRRWLSLVTTGPARILNIDRGRLAAGKVANIAVFDPLETWTVRQEDFHSLSHNSAFLGETIQGRIVATYVKGKEVYRKTT